MIPRLKRGEATLKSLFALSLFFYSPSRCVPQAQPPVVSQNAGTTRAIQGTVVSDKGVPVPGAVVLLKNTKTLQVRSYVAQDNGRYHFYGLSTEVNYELRAQANGLTSKIKTVSVFNSHKLIKVDLKLVRKFKT